MMSNCFALQAGLHVVPFPDCYVPMPQPKEEESEPVPQRKQWSEVQKTMDQQFKAEYAAMLAREIGQE